jgi:hypothetical protein
MSSNQSQSPVLLTPEELRKVQGQSLDLRWQDVLRLGFDSKIEEACVLASDLLNGSLDLLLPPETVDKQIDLELIDGVIGTLNNLALANGGMGKAMLGLYCHAVDMGFYSYAYNAANGLLGAAKSPADYRKAESYFKICIATETDPSTKAAALVNYCPIVRDGLITGERDLEGALTIYRQAANLGLLTAMFNFANVCSWQVSNHEIQHVDEGANWLRKLLKIIADGDELLCMDDPDNIGAMHEHALYLLARFNIDGVLCQSSYAEGVSLLKRSIALSARDLQRKRWNLECAYAHKLMGLGASQGIGINPWYNVLCAIDWKPSRPERAESVGAEIMWVGGEPTPIAFVVMDDLFYPDQLYKGLNHLDNFMQQQGNHQYFVASSHALHKSFSDREITPLIIMSSGARYLAGINLEETPQTQLLACLRGREFADPINRLTTGLIPLTVNVLGQKLEMNCEILPNSQVLLLDKEWKLPFYKIKPIIKMLA